tara:strand:- start:209 stop:661 length:453 start_codon:yes stop_codon:yes gene_type:complete
METITWNENKILMGKLWPRWAPSPEEASILNRKWGSLHQDKLRDCIEQHKLVRNSKPDISAIHKAYCAITPAAAEIAGRSQVDITRRNASAVQGPTPQEYAEWDAWAAEVLKTATQAEIDAARERVGVGVHSDRVLAVLVDYCRNTPRPL